MRKAVKYSLSPAYAGYRRPVILLIEEKACLLTVCDIDKVSYAVLDDRDLRVKGLRKKSLCPLHSFLRPLFRVASLINAPDHHAISSKHIDKFIEDHALHPVHPKRQGLDDEYIFILIDRDTGKKIRVTEHDTAAGCINGILAIVPSILYPLPDEKSVDLLSAISCEHTNTDLGIGIDHTFSHGKAVKVGYPDDIAVQKTALYLRYFVVKYPGSS